jgi:UDP:flavonoid glycosyltransferase YjiC (YdhE family)
MARIAFAWELGGELGHAVACAALANTLSMRGHRIGLMFRELRSLAFLRDTGDYDVFQAPVLPEERPGAPVPATYADIMLAAGFGDAMALAGLVGAWRAIFMRYRPDVVIEDYAPTALLAARTLAIPCIRFGNGFAIPPRASPLPSFRFDQPVSAAGVAESDTRALAGANEVLARFGAPPLARLADLFECADEFLCTFPELDQYGTRGPAGYWGPRFQTTSGARVEWPAGPGKRVLVYVKTALPQLDALIEVLAASPHRVAAFIPDLDSGRRARLAGPRRVVATQPIRLEPLLKECDLLVSHGGNIAPGTLTMGVPQLVFPSQYEQYLTARRVEQLGCGLWLSQEAAAPQVASAVAQMLSGRRFADAARAFARRYPSFSPPEQRRRMALRIEQIADARPILSPSSTSQGKQQ